MSRWCGRGDGRIRHPSQVEFHIESRRGRHVAPWSRQPEEDEVLFPTDALFRVVRVDDDGVPVRVFMREVE